MSLNFQFLEHSQNMKLKDEYKHLKFLLSDESLALLPEYQQRVQVCLSACLSVCYQMKALPSYQSTNNGFKYIFVSVCLLSYESLILLPEYQQRVQVCLCVCWYSV